MIGQFSYFTFNIFVLELFVYCVFDIVRSIIIGFWMAQWRLFDFHVIVFFPSFDCFGSCECGCLNTLLCTNHVCASLSLSSSCLTDILFFSFEHIVCTTLFHWNKSLDFEMTCTYSEMRARAYAHMYLRQCLFVLVSIEIKIHQTEKKDIPAKEKKSNSIRVV